MPDKSVPLVSVVCISYNQEQYIAETLDSLLMQKTKFPIEILVHDDASTDSTQAIIRRYEREHPTVLRTVLQTTNQFSTRGVSFLDDLFKMARGKYIAICEGDDYWTDSQKLQKQAALMEKHPEYGLSFHAVRVLEEGAAKPQDTIFPDPASGQQFTVGALLRGNYIQTNSVMYRKQTYASMPAGVTPKDWYNNLYHLRDYPKVGFIPDVMAVYRRHPGGMWWESDKDVSKIWLKYGLAHLELFVEVLKLYGGKPAYRAIVEGHIVRMFERLGEVDAKHQSGLVEQAAGRFPEAAVLYVDSLKQRIEGGEKEIRGLRKDLEAKRVSGEDLDWRLRQSENQLRLIKNSRFWKLRGRLARLAGRDDA